MFIWLGITREVFWQVNLARNRRISLAQSRQWCRCADLCRLFIAFSFLGALKLVHYLTSKSDYSKHRRCAVLGWCVWVLVWCTCSNRASGDWLDDVNFTQLENILGASAPNGAGVPVALVEALQTKWDDLGTPEPEDDVIIIRNYQPDPNATQFLSGTDPLSQSVTFIDGSNNSCGGVCIGYSTHATNQGQNFFGNTIFGNTTSLAPAANVVTVYEADDYLNKILNMLGSNSTLPDAQNFRVQNHSWVGTYENDSDDREALRRFDYAIDNNNILAAVGLGNSVPSNLPNLLVHSYNALAVGRMDGGHSSGHTVLSGYGTGRSKPDVVMPRLYTSSATSSASSIATFLHSSSGVLGTDAANSETLKAILMAGATKDEFPSWSQLDAGSQWHPLDDTYGAGELNVLNSYLMTVGGKATGSTTTPTTVPSHGWDYQTIQPGIVNALLYDFVVPAGSTAKELSIVSSWNAQISAPFNVGIPVVADLNLELVDSGGATVDITPGNGVVEGLSASTVDNVEHIYISDLPAGTYTLKVSSDSTHDFGLAWRMTTYSPTADFNGDGLVSGADLLAWQQGFGTTVLDPLGVGDLDSDSDIDEDDLDLFALSGTLTNAALGNGDADGDGDVDADDKMFFAQTYGAALPSSSVLQGQTSLATGVPEPSSLLSAILGFFLWGSCRRRAWASV